MIQCENKNSGGKEAIKEISKNIGICNEKGFQGLSPQEVKDYLAHMKRPKKKREESILKL